MSSNNNPLLFDEFEIKEHSTTETLKKGKKAFQSKLIQNVSLEKNSLKGTFTRGAVSKTVEIIKDTPRLIGRIDNKEIKPFSPPITALAYWYIDYVNENKQFASKTRSENHKSLEPFNKIQVVFQYDASHNKINLTFYQPNNDTYCNESHLFIHSLAQIMNHLSPEAKQILTKLQQHTDETFFYINSWTKCDPYISHAIIQLIYLKTLHTIKEKPIEISDQPIHLKITCKILDHQILISFLWVTKDKKESISIFDAMYCEKTYHIIHNTKCYKIENEFHAKVSKQFHNHSFQRLDISKIKPFITKLVELRKKTGIELAVDKNIQNLKEIEIKPICVIDINLDQEEGCEVILLYKYKSITVKTSNPTPYIIFDNFTYCKRDLDLEHEYRDLLLHYHPSSTTEDSLFFKSPHIDNVIGNLVSKKWEDFKLTPTAKENFNVSKETISPQLIFKSGSGFQIKTSIHWLNSNKEKMNQTIHDHIQLGIGSYLDRKTNSIIPINNASLLTPLTKHDDFQLPIGIAIFLALQTDIPIKLPKDLTEYTRIFKNIDSIKINPKISSVLRPFQNKGLKWLLSLHEANLGGILADDMGLGKTIQTIMLLKTLNETKTSPNPTLIIMPKTLLFNWENEFKAFAPSLKILSYDGAKRKNMISKFSSSDIILASYNTIRLDIKSLSDISFNYLILDEAQYVKNSQTNTFKAIKKIKSENKLLITGTPLENSINDLWSLMDIANNKYFGPFKPYENFYGDPQHQPLLKAAIHPFLLRRKKTEVLKDLPPVTVQELWATPSPNEIKAYTTFATQQWSNIEKEIKKNGIEKSKIHIFALMTKLRQWCAHPNLMSKEEEDGPKWLLFFDRLQETISTGHKVVIFSQFIPMINFMESKLNEINIPYISLTGQTKNRETVIEEFNNNEAIRIGIFSLKAGGVGINLTSADYVFLYDPWWNPAVEQQAIDRVHRIGQENPVMVFKCLVASTIEERMIEYQQNKKDLIESLIEERSIKNLDINEIKGLIGIS